MKTANYNNLIDAANNTAIKLKTEGKKTKAGIWQATELFKDLDMLVIRNLMFEVDIPQTVGNLLDDTPDADHQWAEAHFQERIGGKPTNPGESYKIWPYNQFSEKDDPYKDGQLFSHTYQERMWPKDAGIPFKQPNFFTQEEENIPNQGIRYEYGDLNDVINQLLENNLTRQAWLPIFFPEDTGAVHKQRVPCTLGYYFYIEDGKLHCNYVIRSCDLFRHFRNDIYLTCRLAQHVKKEVDHRLNMGKLNFFCFNLHIFENDLYAYNKRYGKDK